MTADRSASACMRSLRRSSSRDGIFAVLGVHPLEAALTRYGYNARVLAELLNVRSAVVRAFLHGQLTHGRTQDLHAQLLAAGLPV